MVRRRRRIVDLPLNATEDRVSGSVDVARALASGEQALEPGLLAEANRGILYVDEINLLDDHLTDVLLDAAALGVNVVEREGVSVSHPGAVPARRDDERGGGRAAPADRRPDRARGRGRGARRAGVAGGGRAPAGGVRRRPGRVPRAAGRTHRRSSRSASRPRRRAWRRFGVPERSLRGGRPGSSSAPASRATAPTSRSSSARRRSPRSPGATRSNADDVLEAAELALGHRLAARPVRACAAGASRRCSGGSLEDALEARGDPKKSGGRGEVGARARVGARTASRPSRASRDRPGHGVRRPPPPRPRSSARGSGRRARSLVGRRRGKYARHRLARPGDHDVALDATLRAAAVRGGATLASPAGGPPPQGPRASLAVQRLLRRRQQLVGARRADGREGEGGRLRAARGRDPARGQGRARRLQGRCARRRTVALPPTASLHAGAARRLRGDPAQRADAARRRAAPGPSAPAGRARCGTRTPCRSSSWSATGCRPCRCGAGGDPDRRRARGSPGAAPGPDRLRRRRGAGVHRRTRGCARRVRRRPRDCRWTASPRACCVDAVEASA